MLTNSPSRRPTYLEEPVVYDWSDAISTNTEVNSIASEAASHRQKLEKLRRDFLSSTTFTNTEDSLLASPPERSCQQAVFAQPILLGTLLASDSWTTNCPSETLSTSITPICDPKLHAFQSEGVDDQLIHPPHLSNVFIDCGHSPTISESLTIDRSGSDDHASFFVRHPVSVVSTDHYMCLSPTGHYSLQMNELVLASSPTSSPVLDTRGPPLDACSSSGPLVTSHTDGTPHFRCTNATQSCPCSCTKYANCACARTALFGVNITERERSPEYKVQPTVTLLTEQRAHCTNHVQTNTVCANSFANWSYQNRASVTADENRSSPTLVSNFNLPPYARLTHRNESAQLTGTTPVQTKMSERDAWYRSKSRCSPSRAGIRQSVVRAAEREYSTAHPSSTRVCSSAQPAEQIAMHLAPSVVPECVYDSGDANRCNTDLNKSPDLLRKKQSMDASLSKMDRTLKDFTSHLSQIDSTLGRMKGFGSLSQYLDNFSNFVGEGCESQQSSSPSPSSTRQASTQESVSSSHSGQSFDCNPIAFETSPKPGDPKHPFALSSSLGASLTTLSSSVWSSLSPSAKVNGCRNTPITTCATRRFDFSSNGQPVTAYPGKHTSSKTNPAAFRDIPHSSCSSDSASVVSVEEPIFRRSVKPRPPANRSPVIVSKFGQRNTNLMQSQSSGRFETNKHMRQSSLSRPDDGRIEGEVQVKGSSSKVYPDSPGAHRSRVPRVTASTGQSAHHRQLHISSPELHVSTRRVHSNHHLEHRALPSTPDLSVNQSAISLSDNKRTNFYPSSHSSGSEQSHYDHSSSSDTQESVHALTEHLSHLLRTGKERKARTVIGDLLSNSTSRSKLRGVVASLSSEGHLTGSAPRYQPGKSDLPEDRKHSPTESLLQLAESLAALTDRREIARPRGSFASLQSYPKRVHGLEYTSSNHSLNEPYGWRPVQEQRYALPSHNGSACSMVSTRSLQFIQWPCDVQVEERLPSMRPKPRPIPPLHPKSAILPPTEVLKRIDMRAVEVTATNYISFTELVQALTAELTDDVQVMRALFSWIIANDLRFKDFDPAAPSGSLVGMLRRIRNGHLCNNELLHKLCRFAGLHSCIIFGYSKDTGYRPGMPVKSNRLFCSSWLAVHVGGGWRFVNVDWAMRASRQNESINPTVDLVDLNSNNGKPMIKEAGQRFCDEFYFLTDPEQHIFEHFPEHKMWQLLAKPIGMDRFVRLPLLKSAFFNANLSLKKNYGDCLVTSNGQVTLKLLMPQFVGISCSLENSADHSILHGLCLVEVLAETDEVRIQVAPSQPGKYYLHCFVAPDWRQEHDRELACAFQIHCSEHNYSRLIVMGRLPEVGFLGPTPAARTLGVVMHTTNRNGRSFLVHTSTDPLRIPFVIAPGLKICHQLKSFDRPGNQMVDCDSYALLQMRPRKLTNSLRSTHNNPNAYYHVRMPVEGFYYLTVYATPNTDVEADHLECVYRVLIDVRKTPAPSTVVAFPRQTFWWVQCRLHEPLSQRLRVNQVYTFRLDAPVCDSVAVVINETDWHFLTNTNNQLGTWIGKINVGEFLGQLSVFGRFWKTVDEFHPSADLSDEESEAYVKLLDYVVVE